MLHWQDAFGFALLSKLTWLIGFGLLPAMWILDRCILRRVDRSILRPLIQLVALLSLGTLILNAGYSFEGTFCRLGDYHFFSKLLAGFQGRNPDVEQGRNRFLGTSLAVVRVPFPRDFVIGFDLQRKNLETPEWSYFHGQFRRGGWWYWYACAIGLKEPLGFLALFAAAIVVILIGAVGRWRLYLQTAMAMCEEDVPNPR